jgi:hypothetical protein
MTDRLTEALTLMTKLRNEVHIPETDPGLKLLSSRLTAYVKYGSVWAGYVAFPSIKRTLHVILPNNPAMPLRAVFKALT